MEHNDKKQNTEKINQRDFLYHNSHPWHHSFVATVYVTIKCNNQIFFNRAITSFPYPNFIDNIVESWDYDREKWHVDRHPNDA